MNAQKTGLLIYEMRTRKGLTQKELAEKCNVTDKAVSKWERGEGCPDVTVLPRLAEIFGIEVESLMNGELPLSQDVSGKTIKDYNFRQPDRYSRSMQRALAILGDDIRKTINQDFTALLNGRCEFSVGMVDQMVNIEFLRSIPKNCFFYDFDFANRGFCIEVDPQIAKALMKQDFSKHELITDFDLDVFKNYFLSKISKVLNEKAGLKTEKITASANTNLIRQEENRMMLLLGLKGNVDGTEGWINIQFSDTIIEDLLQKGWFNTFVPGKFKSQNLKNIKSREAPDNVFIEFGRFTPENVELEPGKILILDKKETDGLDVVYENHIIHTGKAVSIDETFGIEIAETNQLSEIEYTEKDYISIQLGSASLKKEEIAALHQGSYIILKQRAGELSLIIRTGKVIATGEICIAYDNFAIRVIEVK